MLDARLLSLARFQPARDAYYKSVIDRRPVAMGCYTFGKVCTLKGITLQDIQAVAIERPGTTLMEVDGQVSAR